jgi:hypothetical protein
MKFSLEKIFNVDRRVVFVFVFLSLLLPLLSRFTMRCEPVRDVNDMYNAIEAAAAANKPVFLAFEFDPTGAAEQEPMARSVVRHLFARGGKAVVMCKSGGQQGEALHLQILEDCATEYNKEYGVDYVYLPFKPGSTTLVINLGKSLPSAWPKDIRGNNVTDLPLTSGIARLADFDYLMVICSSMTTVVDWITYGQSPYNLKMGFGVLGNVTPDVANYVQSGQVVGLLGGLVGAAQYEQLLIDNNIVDLRRFSSADIMRSQLPNLASKLLDVKATPISERVLNSLSGETRENMRITAEKRFDTMSQRDKQAVAMALNEVIESEGFIADSALEPFKINSEIEKHLSEADSLRIRQRLYVESLFPSELIKSNSPGRAMRWMTPQSVTHIVLIIAIILGNISYFAERARERRERAA